MTILRTCLGLTLALLAVSSPAAELNIYAAASLSDVLRELAPPYEALSGDKLRFNLAASSALALQIKQGAPADVFFSADEAKMDDLAKAGLVETETRCSLLSNTLVIVVNASAGAAISGPLDLAKSEIGRVALADPETVPAGIYAKQYFKKLGLWEKVVAKIVPTENVRACLAAVESGNVDAGIVYKTDASISKKVKIAYEISAAEGPKISYPLAVLRGSKNEQAARKFAKYLGTDAALKVFAKYGFLIRR